MWHVWLGDDGDEIASIDDESHALLSAQFEMKDLGVWGNTHYWSILAEVNYDRDDEEDIDDEADTQHWGAND